MLLQTTTERSILRIRRTYEMILYGTWTTYLSVVSEWNCFTVGRCHNAFKKTRKEEKKPKRKRTNQKERQREKKNNNQSTRQETNNTPMEYVKKLDNLDFQTPTSQLKQKQQLTQKTRNMTTLRVFLEKNKATNTKKTEKSAHHYPHASPERTWLSTWSLFKSIRASDWKLVRVNTLRINGCKRRLKA